MWITRRPYRPGFISNAPGPGFRIYNDTPTTRRVRSLFTAEYTEFLPIERALRKSSASPAGIPPLDSGDIAPGANVAVALPPDTPAGFQFALVDETNAAKYRLFLQNGAHTFAVKGW